MSSFGWTRAQSIRVINFSWGALLRPICHSASTMYGVFPVRGSSLPKAKGCRPATSEEKLRSIGPCKKSEHLIGTWCEYSQLHRLNYVLLPEELDTHDYSGSLVNVITPYAFWKQATTEGYKG